MSEHVCDHGVFVDKNICNHDDFTSEHDYKLFPIL